MQGKLIYSKRYPPFLPEDDDGNSEQCSDEQREQLREEFKQIVRRFEEKKDYVPIPYMEEKSKALIGAAQNLADKFQVDIDIFQTDSEIHIHLSIKCCVYFAAFCGMLAELLLNCDECMLFKPSDQNDNTILLALVLITHTEKRDAIREENG